VGDTSGYLKKLLVTLVQGQRPETNQVNETDAENDAKSLYEAGEKKWGTDESKFIEILSTKRFIFSLLFSIFQILILLVMHT
jgi:NADH:ubiquinone oxidoreductase subunit 3 (subunit A)